MTTEQTPKAAIRDYIINVFLFGEEGETIQDDDSLIGRGIIDSSGVLELVAFIEEKYGIQVEDDELVADNFDSIHRLCGFIQRKQS